MPRTNYFIIIMILLNHITLYGMSNEQSALNARLFEAAKHNNPHEIRKLITAGAHSNARGPYDGTPLIVACAAGNEKSVKALVRTGADINAYNADNQTPLHMAMLFHRAKIVCFLIQKGANIEAVDCNGTTPLFEYITGIGKEYCIFECLLKHNVKLAIQDENNNSLMHLMAKHHRTREIRKCVETGLSLNSKNNLGETPLHSVHYYDDNSDATIITLIELGALIDVGDKAGQTPLLKNKELLAEDDEILKMLTIDNSLSSLKAMVTTFTPEELKHIVTAALWLMKRPENHPFPKDIRHYIMRIIVQELISTKVAFALYHLPDASEIELHNLATQSFRRVFKNPLKINKMSTTLQELAQDQYRGKCCV